jgi:hypothetical protein
MRALLAGFLATAIITFMMYFVSPYLSGHPMDIAGMIAARFGVSWATGLAIHLAFGVLVLPTIYVAFIRNRLEGNAAERGMTWGLMLWLASQAVVMPILGAGVFSTDAGGLRAAIDSLIAHLAYGAVFSGVAGGSRWTAAELENVLRTSSAMRRAQLSRGSDVSA